jgi:hypothetical protein
MQSALPEPPKNATSVNQSQFPPNSIQHGSPDNPDQVSDRLPDAADDREPSAGTDEADTISIASNHSRRGRRANAEWLSSRSSSSQEGSPGYRIEEYERAHKSMRKPATGVIFKVILSARDATNRISVQEFPNGQSSRAGMHIARLTDRRGTYPYPFEPRSRDTLCDESCFPTLPQVDYKPARLENSIFSILPWRRGFAGESCGIRFYQ